MAIVDKNQALQQLKNHDVVALPTETVYGLAGRADSPTALKKIFHTKARPFFDPLIVHVKDLQQGQEWAHFDSVSEELARHFWPGPLTLVLPKNKECVDDLITNGGPTVALRSPAHPDFLEVLEQLNHPLAAPSANMFGKTSPTTALHVVDEFKNQVSVVDGGPCEKGIESTVIQVLPEQEQLMILRPGVINEVHLQEFLNHKGIPLSLTLKTQDNAPGHLKNHYQPTAPMVLIDSPITSENQDLLGPALQKIHSAPWEEMNWQTDPSLAARRLYSQLRDFSQRKQAFYLPLSPELHSPPWRGFMDRILKASIGSLHWNNQQWAFLAKGNEL